MATSRATSTKNKKTTMRDGAFGGFTIIEVVLVLAIAGLIFLMVFIALPQLQRAQRDTQRREDLRRLASAVTQFQTNNNGNIPGQKLAAGSTSTIEGDQVISCNANETSSDGSKDACRLLKTYMNAAGATENAYKDPDGIEYSLTIYGASGELPADFGNSVDHRIYMFTKAKCDGEGITKDGAQPRDYAIVYKLEGSGTYCGGSNN